MRIVLRMLIRTSHRIQDTGSSFRLCPEAPLVDVVNSVVELLRRLVIQRSLS